MTSLELATQAIENYKKNAVIMKFVVGEALEKVAQDIRNKTNSGTTALAVKLLLTNGHDKTISERFDYYVNAGLLGCYLASTSK